MHKLLIKLEDLRYFFDGRKTYLVSALLVLSQIGAVAADLLLVLNGQMAFSDFTQSASLWALLNGLGLGFLRAGISKV